MSSDSVRDSSEEEEEEDYDDDVIAGTGNGNGSGVIVPELHVKMSVFTILKSDLISIALPVPYK